MPQKKKLKNGLRVKVRICLNDPPTKTERYLKFQVFKQLQRGRYKAIPGNLLAKRLGYKNDRAIRIAIRGLIADGIPVASSVIPPVGFFIAETREEVRQYIANIKSRLVEDAYRRRDFLRAAKKIVQPEQMRLLR